MRFLFAAFFLLLLSGQLFAIPDYAFTPIDVNNGLSSNQVRNIAQLPDGRIAIITQGLVNIFDGSKFKYLHFNPKNSVKLSGYSGFHHVYMDKSGYMWLKNNHQLFIIDVNKESFSDEPAYVLSKLGITTPLSDFFMDISKKIWFITTADDLCFVNNSTGKQQLFATKISALAGNNDQVYDLAVLNNKLYLFYRSGVLICIDLQSKKELYRQQSLNEDQRSKYGYTSFVIPHQGQFFQLRNGSGGGTMLSYDFNNRVWKTIMQTNSWFNYLSADKYGSIWLSGRDGMWKFNAQLTQKEFIPQLRLVDGQVINTEVSTIYNDNQGGMWMGTINRGLLYYHPDRFKFKNIGKSFFQLPNAIAVNVSGFTPINANNILVGTRQGLFTYHKHSGAVNRIAVGSGLICTSLIRDNNNLIWIGTDGQGLYSLDTNYHLRAYPESPRVVFSIAVNNNSSLTLSTNWAGFGEFNTTTGKYKRAAVSMQNPFTTVYQTALVNKNTLAGICNGGFFIYNTQTGSIKFKSDNKDYNALYADGNDRIWLGSQDGLHLWNSRQQKICSFYTTNGLINNYVQSITKATDGAIWVATSGGLTRLKYQTNKSGNLEYIFTGFNRLDGIISNEFWERSVYKDVDGSIYWGGTEGFNVLPAKRTTILQKQIAPLFVNFLLFNKEVNIGSNYNGNIILKSGLSQTRKIVLNHDQNFFTLEYSALNYVNPTQTYYRYQLVGIDEHEQQLQSADGNGRFSYTNLQPGTYTFRVRAADNSHNWHNHYAEIEIIIKAPLWKTGVAYFLYLVLAVSGLMFAVNSYIRKKRLKLVKEQKEDLDYMKAEFFKNVNMELSDPLSQILTPLDTILKQTDEGKLKLQLKEIQSNALDMQDLVSQLSQEALLPVEGKENALNMEVLLLKMRTLLQTQEERKLQHDIEKANKPSAAEDLITAADEKLLQRALKYVQENLENPEYTVELLSKDMGMDRTGLYRKLVHIIGKTPTTFIRSVRLKRAAQLLEEGNSVAEVAHKVGFNTSSYLTKCFQEEFGMKPSQYVAALKQQKNA